MMVAGHPVSYGLDSDENLITATLNILIDRTDNP